MLTRTTDFFSFFSLGPSERAFGLEAAKRSGELANGMTHPRDYEALAATALFSRPKRIFEIGTYLGGTSDFFLSILPECTVVSVAYINPAWNILGRRSNNSELPRERIGSSVAAERRSRFTQLYGDSHKLDCASMIKRFGRFDLVFIDGDHSREGVIADTELAHALISDLGTVAWHDANPKRQYEDVRRFLENELPLQAIATEANYIGGIACWSKTIEQRLRIASNAKTEAGVIS